MKRLIERDRDRCALIDSGMSRIGGHGDYRPGYRPCAGPDHRPLPVATYQAAEEGARRRPDCDLGGRFATGIPRVFTHGRSNDGGI
jgi:hypothetical protein